MIKLLFFIVAIALSATPNNTRRVLILSDNPAIYVSHSKFFNLLKELEYKTDFKNIQSITYNLQVYGEWQYDHLIIFATDSPDIRVLEQELLEFYDSGRNILLLGAPDQSKYYRKLINSFGLDMQEQGILVQDYFNNYKSNPLNVITSNVNILTTTKPIAYAGTGLLITPYENNQVWGIVRGSETAISGAVLSQNIVYVGATQGRNNARFIATGGWEIFSDEFLTKTNLGNLELTKEVFLWCFTQIKLLKAENLIHRRINSDDIKPVNYRTSEDVYFSIDIYEWNNDKWIPYTAEDVQLEFFMLDPYYRVPLKQGKKGNYEIEFKIPDKYGVFQFKINYDRPGYSFLKVAEKITVRPFRHDEYRRYLVQAIPYYMSSFGTMIGFLVFLIAFLFNK